MNYYEILEIPVSFLINNEELTACYLEKQAKIHPDIVEGEPLDFDSATLNLAYKVLSDPITRGEYFCKIHGLDTETLNLAEAEKMYALREEYENLTDENQKEEFKKDLKLQIKLLLDELAELEKNPKLFRDKFCVAKFLNSFLEKISLDLYDLY